MPNLGVPLRVGMSKVGRAGTIAIPESDISGSGMGPGGGHVPLEDQSERAELQEGWLITS